MYRVQHFGIPSIFHSMLLHSGHTTLNAVANESGIQISPELSTFGSTREIYRGIKLLARENKATPYIWLDHYDTREYQLSKIFQKMGGFPCDGDGRFERWILPV